MEVPNRDDVAKHNFVSCPILSNKLQTNILKRNDFRNKIRKWDF